MPASTASKGTHINRRAAAARAVAIALALAATITWGSGSHADAAPAPPTHWFQAAAFKSSQVAGLTAISCVDALHCVAVGQSASGVGVAVATSDGGSTWQMSSTGLASTPGLFLTTVSCVPYPPTGYCVAAGRTTAVSSAQVFYSSDGGATWSAGALPSGSTKVVASVTCAAGSLPPTCVAAGDGLYTSDNGGATWTMSGSVAASGSLTSPTVSCANASDCVAGGVGGVPTPPAEGDYYTTDGGAVWSAATADPQAPLTIVSCPSEPVSAIHCVGAQGQFSGYSDDGTSWTPGHGAIVLPSSSDAMASLSCAAVQACTAIATTSKGSELLYADDGGNYWTVDTQAAGVLVRVHTWGDRTIWKPSTGVLSCAGPACFAVGATKTGAPVVLSGPSSLPPILAGEPSGAQLSALVGASVRIERLPTAVLDALPQVADATAANWYALPRTCATTTTCVLGDVAGTRTIVVYGDSHARMWLPAILPAATADGFRVVVVGEDGCTVDSMDLANTRFHLCVHVQAEALADIAALKPTAVILSNRTSYPKLSSSAWEAGMVLTIKRIEADGAKVVLLGDTQPMTEYPETCLKVYRTMAQKCSQANPNRSQPGQEVAERTAAKRTGALYVDPTPWLCTSTRCSEVIGTTVPYWDWHHVSTAYAQVVSNAMAWALRSIL